MTSEQEMPRVVSASREIAASPGRIFELIADPAAQPRWDGNDNLAWAPAGQRVRRTGEVFTMTLTRGAVRENHVVEFEEGRRIAWMPAEPEQERPGHLWRWELEPVGASRTRVTCTYDWTQLTDENRLPRARATTAERLRASLDRLAALAEASLPLPGERRPDRPVPRLIVQAAQASLRQLCLTVDRPADLPDGTRGVHVPAELAAEHVIVSQDGQ
jgi:uncharacterized protein YndB with AHSA1/START domain